MQSSYIQESSIIHTCTKTFERTALICSHTKIFAISIDKIFGPGVGRKVGRVNTGLKREST